MARKLNKWYNGRVDWLTWIDSYVVQGEESFTYDGKDYIIICQVSKDDPCYGLGIDIEKCGDPYTVFDWFITDPVEYTGGVGEPPRLFGTFRTVEELVTASILDGKSIKELYDQLEFFEYDGFLDD